MTIRDVQQLLEAWAPRQIAWDRDNIGLQIGNPNKRVSRILVTLDVTQSVVDEARKKRIDLIISHHPLIFQPLKSLRQDDRIAQLVVELATSDIGLLVAHTNLDFTRDGVNFILAEQLGLQSIEFLKPKARLERKLVVFVPKDHAQKVFSALTKAGAGHIGQYDSCSFQLEGTGTFRPLPGSNPFLGKQNHLEEVDEVRLEVIVPDWKLPSVLTAMRSSHPYEEIAYDVYALENKSILAGEGTIGELPSRVPASKFLRHVRRALKADCIRHSLPGSKHIQRVAVCGGSGSDLIHSAIEQGADAFVTADVRYHAFHEAEGKLLLVDAGHYETEHPAMEAVAHWLKAHPSIHSNKISILTSAVTTNPIHFFTS